VPGPAHWRLFPGRPARGHRAARAQAFSGQGSRRCCSPGRYTGCPVRSASARAESAGATPAASSRIARYRSVPAMQKTSISTGRPAARKMRASSKSHRPHQGVDFPVFRVDPLRCPAHLRELRIAGPGPRLRYLSRRLSLNATPLTGSDSRGSCRARADERAAADGSRPSQAVVWDSVRELSGRGLHGCARDRGLLRLRELTRLRADDARLLKMLELSPRQAAGSVRRRPGLSMLRQGRRHSRS
jgi:hypothetical protein